MICVLAGSLIEKDKSTLRAIDVAIFLAWMETVEEVRLLEKHGILRGVGTLLVSLCTEDHMRLRTVVQIVGQ